MTYTSNHRCSEHKQFLKVPGVSFKRLLPRRVDDLRKHGEAVSTERDRVQEELTEAQERLTAQAAELLQARDDVAKEQTEKRNVRLLYRVSHTAPRYGLRIHMWVLGLGLWS